MTYTREGRSAFERSEQKSLTLDDGLTASHPGGLKVNLWRWSCRNPKWPLILTIAALLVPVMIFQISLMFVAAVPLTIIPAIWYTKRVREHFLYGDANPGVLISTSPALIAVWTDLTKDEGSYPALSVHHERPSDRWGPLQVGTRVATIALYDIGEKEDCPYWERVHPHSVEPIAASADEARALLASFSDEEWERLERAVEELKPTRAGLFKLPQPSNGATTARS